MTTVAQETHSIAAAMFGRIVVGVDGSEPGFEAARQAARLAAPNGWLEVFTAVYLAEAARTGWSAPGMHAELTRKAGEAVRKGAEIAGHRAELRLVNGPPVLSLMLELRDKEATLCVVGTHGHSRLSEIAIGGVAGEVLHSAPCAVYVARPPAAAALFPRAIVAGVDGSPESEAAIAVARYLVERFACPLSLVSALGGKDVNRERVAAFGATAVDGHPVAALTAASKDADILVVGSRGLHGLKSLGSVSERVAHQANCSVIVVRENC